jgi:hypothetical protein
VTSPSARGPCKALAEERPLHLCGCDDAYSCAEQIERQPRFTALGIESRARDPVPSAQLCDLRSGLGLLQNADDLASLKRARFMSAFPSGKHRLLADILQRVSQTK